MQKNKLYGIMDDEFNTKKTNQNFASASGKNADTTTNQQKVVPINNPISNIVNSGFDLKKPKTDSIINQSETGSVTNSARHEDLIVKFPEVPLQNNGEVNKKDTNTDTNKDKVNQQRAEVLPAINKVYNGMQEKADNRKWDMPTEDVKKTQTFLNDFGYTDRDGKSLDVDGILGPKTKFALEKYLQGNIPKQDVFNLQATLNKNGFKDNTGNPLKTDGILGKKTDSAANGALLKIESPEELMLKAGQKNTPIKTAEKYSNDTKGNSTLDNISTALGAASLIPGLDTFADIAAIPVDIARGDWVSAGLDLAGALPFVGEVADTAIIARKADKAIDAVKAADKAIDTAKVADDVAEAVGSMLLDGLVTGGVYASSGRNFGAGFLNGCADGIVTAAGERVGGIPGTVIGSTLGSALGSLSEDLMSNKDKSAEDIAKSAAESAAWGIVSGVGSAYLKHAIDLAEEAGSAAQELMKYDERFGKALKTFFEQVVNILSAQ